jgi:hypothetical protein
VPHRRDPQGEEQRRRVFRQMAWTFVYLPPLLVALFALTGGALLALFVPFPFTAYAARWLFWAGALVLLGIGLYLVMRERDDG